VRYCHQLHHLVFHNTNVIIPVLGTCVCLMFIVRERVYLYYVPVRITPHAGKEKFAHCFPREFLDKVT
jgi:hypothetical protein